MTPNQFSNLFCVKLNDFSLTQLLIKVIYNGEVMVRSLLSYLEIEIVHVDRAISSLTVTQNIVRTFNHIRAHVYFNHILFQFFQMNTQKNNSIRRKH